MDITVSFPGGKRVDAQVGAFLIPTDQPATGGGEGAAPAPYDLFLASVATCAGIYALGFCQARGLSTEGLSLAVHTDEDPASHVVTAFRIDLTLPVGFPDKWRPAIAKAVEGCKVKKTIAAMPTFAVNVASQEGPCVDA